MKLPAFKGWRTLLPALAFAGSIALLASFRYPLPDYADLLLWWTRLDPLLLLQQLRAGHMPSWLWLPLLLLGLTLFFGRFFCGWLCPLGGLLAIVNGLKPKTVPAWVQRLAPYRNAWLIFLLALLVLGSSWPLFLSPFHLLTAELTQLWQLKIPWLLLGILVSAIWIFPRFWCTYLCPTGLLLSQVSRWRKLRVTPPAACIHCGACQQICPTASTLPDLLTTSPDCILCGRCTEKCPVGPFEILSSRSEPASPEIEFGSFSRREILRSGCALFLAGAASPMLAKPVGANPLRPPGALEEDDFLLHCSRCGRCVKVCPSQCLHPMPLNSGAAMFMTPRLIPRLSRCELCQQCQDVCPTGAIVKTPIPETFIGLAVIDQSRCLGWAEGKLCLVCKEQCPRHAIDSDSLHRPSVQRNLCVGCGGCENACPIDPAAIVVNPQAKRRHGRKGERH